AAIAIKHRNHAAETAMITAPKRRLMHGSPRSHETRAQIAPNITNSLVWQRRMFIRRNKSPIGIVDCLSSLFPGNSRHSLQSIGVSSARIANALRRTCIGKPLQQLDNRTLAFTPDKVIDIWRIER